MELFCTTASAIYAKTGTPGANTPTYGSSNRTEPSRTVRYFLEVEWTIREELGHAPPILKVQPMVTVSVHHMYQPAVTSAG